MRSACDMGLEGVMGKKKGAAYVSGRTQSWIKLKCSRRQEFVVAGYTSPTTAGRGFKSLVLGVHDGNGQLRYAGKVGTGFNSRNSGMIMQQLERLVTEQSPLAEIPKGIQANWLRPNWWPKCHSQSGPGMEGSDMGCFTGCAPTRRLPPLPVKSQPASPTLRPAPHSIKPPNKAKEPPNLPKISNPDRVVDPTTSLTKMDLVNYYRAAARWILPHLQDRPVSFLRAPEGWAGNSSFKNMEKS